MMCNQSAMVKFLLAEFIAAHSYDFHKAQLGRSARGELR